MRDIFTSNQTRKNPHTLYTGRQIHALSARERKKIARGIADVEKQVHGNLGYGQHADLSDIIGTVEHHRDVIIGVTYARPEDRIGGPYMGYIMGYEIDMEEGLFDDEIEAFTEVTGLTYDQLIEKIPMGKLFHLEDQARLPGDESKREFYGLYTDFVRYAQSNGLGFVGEARESTTYNFMKGGRYGDMKFLYERFRPNYFGPGDHMYDIVAYWEKV